MSQTFANRSQMNRTSRSAARVQESASQAGETMRAIGFFLMLLSAVALSYDTYAMVSGRGLANFAGIKDIWAYMDKTSFTIIQQTISQKLGMGVWSYAVNPLLTLPAAALFGLPGLLLLRKYSPDIQLRAPSAIEIEMQRAGLNPRTGTRRRY